MKTLIIALPDVIARLVESEAARTKIDPASVCSTVVSEYFLSENVLKHTSVIANGTEDRSFDIRVGDLFPGAPRRSIEFAQALVDEGTNLPGVRAFRNDRGIGFEPNFAFIEYLRKGSRGGVMLSLYGAPERHGNSLLSKGRTTSYSRVSLNTSEELLSVLPHLRKAYEMKLG